MAGVIGPNWGYNLAMAGLTLEHALSHRMPLVTAIAVAAATNSDTGFFFFSYKNNKPHRKLTGEVDIVWV